MRPKLKNSPTTNWLVAVETSSLQGSLALFRDHQLVSEITWHRQGSHAEVATGALQSLLKIASIEVNDLNAVAVNIGPGSFTGVRVGVNLAKSLGFGLGIPLICRNTFDVLANKTPATHPYCTIVLNAYSGLVFRCTYQRTERGWLKAGPQEHLLSLQELGTNIPSNCLVVGETGLLGLSGQFETRCDLPHAISLGELACKDLSSGKVHNWTEVHPLYLRASRAEENKKV
ncbi:MAG: tRNA (adenosine(37)-N6)-threonylcarbamoyltransferase complex dimerization subunit type 1 TsaB [Bdellovibrionales bacterium CG10_big_fil_rev_8_21_14_0_10_45_34]|nr:MAG: tRNA (adenosine(37)-N6)-threonylcarbamoyltransferase complex dimerization subunit type 1 TsaB [Bdellovibrionales bacterium CG10_big_fil_rev_8_21_14_0_10_45_34]